MYCTHYIPSVLICICTINKDKDKDKGEAQYCYICSSGGYSRSCLFGGSVLEVRYLTSEDWTCLIVTRLAFLISYELLYTVA